MAVFTVRLLQSHSIDIFSVKCEYSDSKIHIVIFIFIVTAKQKCLLGEGLM